MKIKNFILFIVIIFSGTVLLISASDDISTSNKRIRFADKTYSYDLSYEKLDVKNEKGISVFYALSENKNTHIIGFDFSKKNDAFYVFKIEYFPIEKKHTLILEFAGFSYRVIEKSNTSFYTPQLVEFNNDSSYVIFISEDHTIQIANILNNSDLYSLKMPTQIMGLKKTENQNILQFKRFVNGKYETKYLNIKEYIQTENKSNLKQPLNNGIIRTEKEHLLGPKPDIDQIALELQYDKVVGFGDSITYGKINREPFPELGYIPRLQILFHDLLYNDGVIINEGNSGTETLSALARIESTLLEHKAKFLLFHYGTNDVVHLEIPVSTSVSNIEAMIDIALKYNIKPILTTLIPRNSNWDAPRFRDRALEICKEIRKIALEKDIALIDFWEIFTNFPEENGGYMSLMSDKVHPNEKGYQLMAEHWMDTLLDFKPINILEFTKGSSKDMQVEIKWNPNPELDLSHYKILYGFSKNNLNRESTSFGSTYKFILTPVQNSFFNNIYFKIQSVDLRDNYSNFSPSFDIELNN